MARTDFSPRVTDENDIQSRYVSLPPVLNFGLPDTSDALADFAVPIIQFRFKTSTNEVISDSPTINVKAPNSLSLQQQANYSPAAGIFGGADIFPSITTEDSGPVIKWLGETGSTLSQAILSKLVAKSAEGAGYLTSAGQGGIDQFEFSTRNVMNPFQQLLYKGSAPKFYNFPIVMRPKNLNEAKSMTDIISAFKIANSPKVAQGAYAAEDGAGLLASGLSSIAEIANSNLALTFGYPDLVEFDIMMMRGNSITSMYLSLPCVINTVSTDYGQQKMTFFLPDGNEAYYPTEVTLTLSLQEIAARSVKDAMDEAALETNTLR